MKLSNNILKTISSLALAAGLLFGAASCKDKEDVKSVEFALSSNQFNFLAEGGSGSVVVNTDGEWTVESNVEWCLISPANGFGTVECEVRVDTSYLYDARDAVVTFHSGSASKQIVINQLGYKKVIIPEEVDFTVPDYNEYGKTFVEVSVSANVDFEVVLPEDASWLSYEIEDIHQSSIPRARKVKFEYKINSDPQIRMADIVLKPIAENDKEAEPATLKITQQAAPLITPSREGDSLSIVMLARLLRVNNDPSSSGKAMVNWDNVELREFPVENGAEGETELRVVSLGLAIFDTKESLPYQIKFLTKLEKFSLVGNTNGYLKSIEWTPEICELKNLKSLEMTGYGLVTIPEELRNMQSLEAINLSGNYFHKLPIDIFRDMPNLKHIEMTGCRRDGIRDLSTNLEENIGLKGQLPYELFELDHIQTLHLSYNYFEGEIPDMPIGSMPNLTSLKLNLNFLTGEAPEWILKHPYFGCWSPSMFIFTQDDGKDSAGKRVGLTNEPKRIPTCPLN
ncbi:MAG: BACON domain-containing carbohydrate-binding protein [Bacteroidales bacterium]